MHMYHSYIVALLYAAAVFLQADGKNWQWPLCIHAHHSEHHLPFQLFFFIHSSFSHSCPFCCMSASLDKPAKSMSRDALLPLQYVSWSSEGALLDNQCTGPFTCTALRYVHPIFKGQCVYMVWHNNFTTRNLLCLLQNFSLNYICPQIKLWMLQIWNKEAE